MSSNLSDLIDWLHSVGVWWDESLVQIRGNCSNCSGPALGVFAVADIKENQLLCVIPRAAMLSPRTTQLAQVLEAEKLGGGLALTIAVMYEASLGHASKWAGYFASLPRREYLPMFWNDDELQLLTGTALEGVVQEDREDTATDYQQHVAPLMDKYPHVFPHPALCSLQHFRVAASWVASRSFYVDNWHGDAMVPLADIFNHKASLVLLGDDWQVAEELDSQQQQRTKVRALTNGTQPLDAAHHTDVGAQQDSADELLNQELDGNAGQSLGEDSGDDEANESDESGSEDQQSDDESNHSEQSCESRSEGDEEAVESEEDPQHGFAVGGMPMIVAAAAAADGGRGDIVQKAACFWVRDGVDLRLEIGICSMGDADTTLASPNATTAPAPPAAATATAGNVIDNKQCTHEHEHFDCCGCAHNGEEFEHDKRENESQQHKRSAAETAGEQQQAKKQRRHAEQQCKQQQHFPDKRLEIVAASPVAAGAEVHNTYGELSNQVLVHKYGFCLAVNPFDEVQLGPSWQWLLQEVVKAAGHRTQLKQHITWLRQNSHLLPDNAAELSEAEDPPAVAPGGRLPLLVAAVVRLLGMPASELIIMDSLQSLLKAPAQQPQRQRQANTKSEKQEKHQKAGSAAQQAAQNDTGMTAAAAAAAAGAAGSTAGTEAALAEHFQDILLTSRDVTWWGEAGLQVLQQAVQQRLQQYPSKGVCIAQDEQLVQQLCSQQQEVQQKGRNQGMQTAEGVERGGAESWHPGEHGAAVAAAVQLRSCEQRILQQTLDAIQQVLTGSLGQ